MDRSKKSTFLEGSAQALREIRPGFVSKHSPRSYACIVSDVDERGPGRIAPKKAKIPI